MHVFMILFAAWQTGRPLGAAPSVGVVRAPAPRAFVPSQGVVAARPSAAATRCEAPIALLPKALFAVFLIPWGIQICYATEVSLGIVNGPFQRFAKSDAVQKGPSMKRMKKEPPKVRGVRLPAEVTEITRGFKKVYPVKDVEVLWAALLKCYGSQDAALAAARTNPQMVSG